MKTNPKMDPGQGFEPWLAGPEPAVLPLDDPGMLSCPDLVGIGCEASLD